MKILIKKMHKLLKNFKMKIQNTKNSQKFKINNLKIG